MGHKDLARAGPQTDPKVVSLQASIGDQHQAPAATRTTPTIPMIRLRPKPR